MKYCIHCGEQLPDTAAFCFSCGEPQEGLIPGGEHRLRTQNQNRYSNYPERLSYRDSNTVMPREVKRRVMTPNGIIIQKREVIDEDGFVHTEINYDGKLGEEIDRQERAKYEPQIKHRNAGGQAKRPGKDSNFSKFLEVPLPFRPIKLVLGVLMLLLAVFAAYNAIKDGALVILTIPEAAGKELADIPLAVIWIAAGIIGITTKFNRGATSAAGGMLLFAAGIAFTTRDGVRFGEYYAVFSAIAAVIFLISGAGGIKIDLDD